jgi:glycosyltransferase involved in cell wall biosynthesis
MTFNTSKRHVCLVTDEVMPFTRGGIGAFVRNMLDAHAEDFRFSILFSGAEAPDPQLWAERYPSVDLYHVDELQSLRQDAFAWEGRFPRHPFMTRSSRICGALMELSQEGIEFDLVEFLDWGGPGYFAIQSKLCGVWPTRAVLAVRIHCTESVLRTFEFRYPDRLHSVIQDIERKALADADAVVASLGAVADYYAGLYGFDAAWRARVAVEAPHVWVAQRAESAGRPGPDTSIVFSSKLQEIKRPKLFLNGALLFLERRRDYRGDIVFAAFKASDGALGDALSMLSREQASRVKFEPSLSETRRNALIASSVVVFPNAFEAFCFAAYEASLSGAIVVLNARNPAFGESSAWKDGVNCFKFDGTASGLADTLEAVFSAKAPRLSAVDLGKAAIPYWGTVALPSADEAPAPRADTAALTVFILHRDQALALEATVTSLLLEDVRLQIVVLDDASTNPDAVLALTQIADSQTATVTVRKSQVRMGWGALLNQARRDCKTEFACIMTAGSTVTIGAIGAFIEALAGAPAFDVLLPTSALTHSAGASEPSYIFHPLGEALASGELENVYAAHMFVARTSVFLDYNFSETITNNFEWEYLRRLALTGHRMLVWPVADVNYFTPTIGAYETYRPEDFAFNKDQVSKVQSGSQGLGLSIDRVSPASVQSFVEVQMPVGRQDSAPPPQIAPPPLMSDEDASELELRRRLAQTPPKPVGVLGRAYSKIGFGKNQFRSHIDALVPAIIRDGVATVSGGSQLVISGWAFGREANGYVLSDVALVKGGTLHTSASTTRHRRLDVCLTFAIPEDFWVGFSSQFETVNLTPGEYKILLTYKIREKTVRRDTGKTFILE